MAKPVRVLGSDTRQMRSTKRSQLRGVKQTLTFDTSHTLHHASGRGATTDLICINGLLVAGRLGRKSESGRFLSLSFDCRLAAAAKPASPPDDTVGTPSAFAPSPAGSLQHESGCSPPDAGDLGYAAGSTQY